MQTLHSPDLEAFLALDFRAVVVPGDFKAYEIHARQPGATYTAQKRERQIEGYKKRETKRERKGDSEWVGAAKLAYSPLATH